MQRLDAPAVGQRVPKPFFPRLVAHLMRVIVTGATNAYGQAIAEALAEAGHEVRAFGVPLGAQPFGELPIACFPGTIEVTGSIEPVASECQAVVAELRTVKVAA